MKKQNSREMTGAEPTVKTRVVASAKRKIRCLRDCEMPRVGLFTSGQIIEDEGKIASIADNPNFEIVKEG